MSTTREYLSMQWSRARAQGKRYGAGLPPGQLDGKTLRTVREKQGLTLEGAAEFLGLEPHVLSGIEKGYRTLSGPQMDAVGSRLQRMGSRPPGASRPPMPEAK